MKTNKVKQSRSFFSPLKLKDKYISLTSQPTTFADLLQLSTQNLMKMKKKISNLERHCSNQQFVTSALFSFCSEEKNKICQSLSKQKNIKPIQSLKNLPKLTKNSSYTIKSPSFKKKQTINLKQTASTNFIENCKEAKYIKVVENLTKPSNFIPQFVKQRSSNKEIKITNLKSEKKLDKNQFIFIKKIGQGKFGKVYLTIEKQSGLVFAIKILQKRKIILENLIEQTIRELKIQSFLNHPFIIKLYTVFDDQDHIYAVLQLAIGQHLYNFSKSKALSEQAISFIAKHILEGIHYMHSKSILHRDIKPENIVLIHGIAKLCDLGWAVEKKSQLRSTFCGTPLYFSPELLKGNQYDQKVDVWAIGVLVFQSFFNKSPFEITQKAHLDRIITSQVLFPPNKHSAISFYMKEFINLILQKNPKQRASTSQLLRTKFISQYKNLETCSELCCN